MDIFSGTIDYFIKGGPVMYPLLLCSIILLMLAVERYLFYRQADSGSKFVERFIDFLEFGRWEEAKEYAAQSKGEAAAIAVDIMEKSLNAPEKIEFYIAAKAERAIDRLEEYISYIAVIVTLSPVLGLLGTITGMIASFNALDARAENPMAVTAGIGEALITTVFGLCISIVAICIHTYFAQRLKIATLNIEETGNALLQSTEKISKGI